MDPLFRFEKGDRVKYTSEFTNFEGLVIGPFQMKDGRRMVLVASGDRLYVVPNGSKHMEVL